MAGAATLRKAAPPQERADKPEERAAKPAAQRRGRIALVAPAPPTLSAFPADPVFIAECLRVFGPAARGGDLPTRLAKLAAEDFSSAIYCVSLVPDRSFYQTLLDEGIPAVAVGKFAALIGKSKEEVFDRVGISRATAHRLESGGKSISRLESDAFADMVNVVEKARLMLGSDDGLKQWIDTPVPALDHQTPWNAMADMRGRRDVSHLLDVIAAGTFA